MKKIIGGKRYDTEAAKEIGRDWYSNPRDFNHWEEVLYQKRTGEYFLHGAGGPASKYARSIGQNEWSGGEELIPLTLEAAQRWAEAHMSADAYEAHFGAIEETEEKKTVSFSLPLDAIEKVKREASAKNLTLSEYVAEAIRACV